MMKHTSPLPLALLVAALPVLAGPEAPSSATTTPGSASAVSAQPASAPGSAASAPAAGLSVSADLRDEYLAGQDMLVLVTLSNGGSAPVTVPDLTARPWRVKFKFTLPSGQAQNRFTTPPAQEPTASWTIPARSQKRVLLEVPSGDGLKEGSYTLSVEVDLGDRKETLPARPVRVAAAKPVAGHLGPDPILTEREGAQSLWVHQASKGYDLYLSVADARTADRVVRNDFLVHLDRKVDPQLTAARAGQGDRYVVWAESERALGYVRIQSSRVEDAPRSVELPWPKVELIGQGATDAKGELHVPVWVPSPQASNNSGELRLVSVDERGRPQLRKMATLTARPAQVRTTVDVAGGVIVLVQREGLLDLYTLRPDYPADVPVPGERLWAAAEGQTLLTARFGSVPQAEGQAGGLGVLAAWAQAGNVEAQWLSLQGKALQRLPATPVSPGSQLLELVPRGKEPAGLVLASAEGAVSYVEGAAKASLTLPSAPWKLQRDLQGRPVLLSLEPKLGVRGRVLEPKAPQP